MKPVVSIGACYVSLRLNLAKQVVRKDDMFSPGAGRTVKENRSRKPFPEKARQLDKRLQVYARMPLTF